MVTFRIVVLTVLTVVITRSTHANDFDHTHRAWDAILQDHVDNGRVDYVALLANRTALNTYTQALGAVRKREIAGWSRQQRLAYWINAYNAFTFNAVLDHWPLKRRGLKGRLYPANSIRQIPGVWDSLTWRAGGETVTLNAIEHDKLRRELNEPRIHFAVVCASIGCPDLLNRAFRADHVDEQLDRATRSFVSNPQKVRVDLATRTLYLSPIFKWFREDFDAFTGATGYGKWSGVVSFWLQQLDTETMKRAKGNVLTIEWLDYDWSLNQLP